MSAIKTLTMTTGEFELRWMAVERRDVSQDGSFLYAVKSTGVYCRPSCPSRKPRRENVAFFPAPAEAERAGYRACLRCKPLGPAPQAEMVEQLCRHIEKTLDEPLRLATLAAKFGMSLWHLQRTFKRALGISPREYADSCRIRELKKQLKRGEAVTAAMYDAGFGSSSRLYESSNEKMGMTPRDYKNGAEGIVIGYITVQSPVGRMLVATTDKGICSVAFGDSDGKLLEKLRTEYPAAKVQRSTAVLQRWVSALLQQMQGQRQDERLPLDVRATAFQRLVWNHLRTIPYGTTTSYSEVARAIGQPKAVRAVARACATNPVAYTVPCHRVLRQGGEMGGYRWGVERKSKLLEMEKNGLPANRIRKRHGDGVPVPNVNR